MKLTPKQRSRLFIAQALYQYQVAGGELLELRNEFLNKKEGKIAKTFFVEVFDGIIKNLDELDQIIDKLKLEIEPVERAILYLGVYELKYNLATPYRVVINECLNLAESIGADGLLQVINATLDKLSQKFRKFEQD